MSRGESVIWIVAFCRFAEAIGIGMVIPILPIFLLDLESGPTFSGFTPGEQTGILFGCAGLAIAGVQLVAGRFSDRLDRRKVFIWGGLLLGGVCSLSFSIIDHYSQLLTIRILQGIFLGLTFSPMMAIIAYHAPQGRGGRVLGVYSTVRLVGFSSGPLVGGFMSDLAGYRATFILSAILLFVSTAMVLAWVPEHRDPAPPGKRRRVPLVFWINASAIFLMMVGVSPVISLFPYYKSEFGASETQLGLCYGGFVAARCLLQYPCGLYADRLDKKWVLIGALVLFMPIVLLQGFARGMTDLIVLRVLLGAVSAAITTSAGGIAAERSPPGVRASAMSTNTLAFSLGVSVGPVIGGLLAPPGSLLPFAIPAGATVLVMMAVIALVPSDRRWSSGRSESSTQPASSAAPAQSNAPA